MSQPPHPTKQFVPIATTNEDQELFARMLKQKEFDAAQQQSTEHLPNKVLPPPTALVYASSLNRDYEQSIAEMLKNRRKSLSEQEKQTYKDAREPQLKGKHNFKILQTFSWEWILIVCGMIASAIYGIMPLVFYLIFGTFVDDAIDYAKLDITAQELRDNIVNYTIGFACIGIGGGLSSFLAQMFMNIAGDRLAIRLRRSYFNALISQEMGFFDIKSSGALTAPIFEDVAKIQDAYTLKLSLVCTHVATTIAGVVMAVTTNWKMTLILISCTPLVVVVITICTKFIEAFTNRINNAVMRAAGVAGEVSSSIKTIRSMAGDRREKERFGKALAGAPFSIVGKGIAQGIAMGNAYMVINGFFALTFWYGGSIVIDGDATLGEMVKVFGIMLLSILGLNQAADNLPYFAKANSSQQALLKVILREPEITEPINGKKIENLKGEITVEGIEFAYPSRPHLTILKDFNLTIKAGTSVALVGGSGSGKSTIIGLLERFYVPQKGRVLLDGVDIKELDTEWLHQVIGIVTQEPTLFQGTIKENIAYSIGGLTGKKDAKQSQIEEAAKAANAHNFILELPNGYNTRLGEKGVSLSGGQKQRIAIARAILQNPQILLLDEATSALDAESEGLVQEALDRLMKGRTTICVAHRLATIKNSNEICVMDHGVIRERGTHEELIRNPNGMYRSLAAKQSMV